MTNSNSREWRFEGWKIVDRLEGALRSIEWKEQSKIRKEWGIMLTGGPGVSVVVTFEGVLFPVVDDW